MINFLRKIFSSKFHSKRDDFVFDFWEHVFLNKNVVSEIRENGFIKLSFLSEEEIVPLKEGFDTYLNQTGGLKSGLFYTSGRDIEHNRMLAKSTTWPFLEKYFQRIFNLKDLHIEGCAWLIKPSGNEGDLAPHQDSSLIDERIFSSLYGWMPLIDVNEKNGGLFVLPGSHSWGNHFRSLDVPWVFDKYTHILNKYCVNLEVKAGEIVFFEGALIHGSGPNLSSEIRPAVNFFLKPKHAPFIHFMRDEKTPIGKIESFKIDMDFFYRENFRERPNTNKYTFMGYCDMPVFKLNEKAVRVLCEMK